jgi:hypothetical protein
MPIGMLFKLQLSAAQTDFSLFRVLYVTSFYVLFKIIV